MILTSFPIIIIFFSCRLLKLLNEIANEPETKTMIFVETKRKVDEIARAVSRYGYQALAIHGDKSQNDRDYVLNQFRIGRVNILVATDVAARGLGMLCQNFFCIMSILLLVMRTLRFKVFLL